MTGEVNQNLINKVNNTLCDYCDRKELEMCGGFCYLHWCRQWEGCKQAKELYKKLKGER